MAWRRGSKVQEPVEALFDPTKVDLLSISPDRSTVLLHIVNDSPWTGSDAQIDSLQQKIQMYVGFAVDGQLVAAHAKAEGMPWCIVINDQAGPMDARSADTVSRVAPKLKEYGGDIRVA